jgi:hypothetical protein
MCSSREGKTDIVEVLLKKGANIEAKDKVLFLNTVSVTFFLTFFSSVGR